MKQFHDSVVRTYRTNQQIESLLMPAVGFIGYLSEIAMQASGKARNKARASLCGLLDLTEKLTDRFEGQDNLARRDNPPMSRLECFRKELANRTRRVPAKLK